MVLLSLKVSAPGKVILHGEHSVVYGKLAIAASLDLRTSVCLQEKTNNKLDINFVDLKFRHKFDLEDIKNVFKDQPFPVLNSKTFTNQTPEHLNHSEYISLITSSLNLQELEKQHYSSLISLLYLYFGIIHSTKTEIAPLLITIKTNLSLGSGTGSSASLMVSLSGAFYHYTQLKASKAVKSFTENDLNLISKWSFAAEKIIHGNPSGIDNTVCTYGSMVSFRKNRAPFAVKTSGDISGILIDTKVPKDTKKMVGIVADLKTRRPRIVEAILDAMEGLTDEALDILIRLGEVGKNDAETDICFDNLKELSRLNHDLLRALGVSHPSLEQVVDILRLHELPAKLTGAGGGGFALALRPRNIPDKKIIDVCTELRQKGFEAIVTKLGGDGVRIEP